MQVYAVRRGMAVHVLYVVWPVACVSEPCAVTSTSLYWAVVCANFFPLFIYVDCCKSTMEDRMINDGPYLRIKMSWKEA